ncbi:GEVED domain-containing protein [Thermaurantimonas aggregans]|uniref:GEVED domain-containing protein n=1 Tax=Thermaurantimonas aggregans TaxID=2173829 RepID=UPI0023F216FF|nr:GEVED domain-containing protein [Thermaurantimonas aggregans]MCX8147745.1 GEVED domain-containing protein [Thermaurantimonas aggregans]
MTKIYSRNLFLKLFFLTGLITGVQFSYAQTYCIPTNSCVSGDQIENFSTTGGVTNISNLNSGCSPNGYQFFSNQVVTALPGTQINFTVQSGSSWSQGFRIWADWNNDGDFVDAGEDLWNSVTWATTPFNGSFTIPVGTPPGNVRLRVRCNYVAVPTSPCDPQTFGETEDYVINVLPTAPCTSPPPVATTIASDTSVCPGTTVNFSLANITFGAGQTYQWQSAPSASGPWTDITGATSPVYSQAVSTTTFFRCNVTCGSASTPSTTRQVIAAGNNFNGVYTINPSGSGPNNFTSFTAFANALACGSVTGPVTVNVAPNSGPYTEQIVLPYVPGTSPTNKIVINGNNNIIRFDAVNSALRHTIELNGAKHFEFNNLQILSLGVSNGHALEFRNSADSNKFVGCVIGHIDMENTSFNIGAIVFSNSKTSTTGQGNNGNYNEFINNIIQGGYYTISLNGSATTPNTGNKFINNEIRNSYLYSVWGQNVDDLVFEGNNVHRLTRNTLTTCYYLYISGTNNRRNKILRNRFHAPFEQQPNTTSSFYGIWFTAGATNAADRNLIANNIFYNIRTNGVIYTWYHTGSTGYFDFFHNTISINNPTANSASANRLVWISTTPDSMRIRNNVFTCIRGTAGSGQNHIIYLSSSTYTPIIDNNVYFIDTIHPVNFVGFRGSNVKTWSNWKSVASGAFEQNGEYANPIYENESAGNLKPINPAINNIGFDLTAIVPNDILNITRTVPPDPGAYEFSPLPGVDAVLTTFISPSPGSGCTGNIAASVNLSNYGLTNLTFARIQWSVNGVLQSPVNFTGNLATAVNQSISLGTFAATPGQTYNLVAYVDSVAPGIDANPSNDTTSRAYNTNGLFGTYTINAGQPASATNFQSFNALANALHTNGVCGPVTVNVVPGSGPYIEQVQFNPIVGASATNRITINGNGDTIRFDATNSASNFVIRLNGADFFTFDSLNVRATNASNSWGFHLTSNADHNIIRKCRIECPLNTTFNNVPIVISGTNTSSTTFGNCGNYNLIEDNTIIGGYYGLTVMGVSSTSAGLSKFNRIQNNKFLDYYLAGVYAGPNDSLEVVRNEFSQPTRTTHTTFYGVLFSGYYNNCRIVGNLIHNAFNAATTFPTSAAYPIYISGGSDAGQWNLIANNIIRDIKTNGLIYGIYFLSSCNWWKVYHNTIAIYLPNAVSSSATRLVWHATANDSIRYMNNLFYLMRAGTGQKYIMYLNSSTSRPLINHNAYFIHDSVGTNYFFGWRGSNVNTFADWQALANNAFDQQGRYANPNFVSIWTGNVQPTNVLFNGMGFNLQNWVPTDFFGTPRGAFPDAGAIEFNPPPGPDPAIVSFTQPTGAICDTFATAQVQIANLGLDTVTSLTIAWSVDNTPQTPVNWTGVLASSQSVNITLGTFNVPANALVNVTATITASGPGVDTDPSNNTLTRSGIRRSLSGTYTINAFSATSGSNFASFTDFANTLSQVGVCGPVTVNVVPGSGPYVEQAYFGTIPNTSVANTVTLKGNGESISFNSNNTDRRAIIAFEGTRNFVLDSLNISSTGTISQFATGVYITGNAENITVKNCSIVMPMNFTNTNYNGILASISESSITGIGKVCDRITIEKNFISGGYQNIYLGGNTATTGPFTVGNKILNNTLADAYIYSFFTRGVDSLEFNGNDIHRLNRQTVTTFYGIYISNEIRNSKITNNRIRNPYASATSITGSAFGFYNFTSSGNPNNRNLFANNWMYGWENTGFNYCFYLSGSSNWNVYHNSISIEHNSTGTGGEYLIYLLGTMSNIDIRNNLITTSRPTTGTSYIIYQSNTVTNITYNHNAYWRQTNSTSAFFGFNGSNINTFANWQASTGNPDSNSQFGQPFYVNPAANDFTPGSPQFNNIGANLLTVVPTDINGVSRTSTPDPGAVEFVPLPCTGPFNFTLVSATPTSATLNWGSFDNNHQIEWGPVGFTPGSLQGTLITNITTKPYTVTGLSSNVCYDMYVRDSCGPNQYSQWVGPVQVCTPIAFDARLEALVNPRNGQCGDSVMNVRVVVKNEGANPISNVPVTCQITGDLTQTFTASVPSLAAGARDTINMGTINGFQGLNLNILSFTSLPNDQVTSNDSLNLQVFIKPRNPVVLPFSVCTGIDTITLQAKPGPGLLYEWYGQPTGGTPLATSNTFFVPSISTKNDYYLQYRQIVGDSASATHGPLVQSAGTFINSATSFSSCPGILKIAVPAGAVIDSIRVSYSITATGGGWISEQLSRIRVVNNNAAEPVVVGPALNQGGTQAYSRTLNIANGVINSDTLTLELHVGRTWPDGGTGPCNDLYQFVPANSWTATVYYQASACSQVRTPVIITPTPKPTASFTFTQIPTSYTVTFNGVATNADSVHWDFAGLGTANTLNATFTFPQNGKYGVCFSAFNECGDTTVCDTLEFKVSTAEHLLGSFLKVYPNPNTGVFEVTFSDDVASLPIEVVDLTGKVIYRTEWRSAGGTFRETIKLEDVAAGTYLLRVHSSAGIINRKVVIGK